jgi:hypothetical protein
MRIPGLRLFNLDDRIDQNDRRIIFQRRAMIPI